MTVYDEATKARVSAAIDAALGTKTRRTSSAPKRMTKAKAERLVAALAVVMECEDVEGSAMLAFEDARAEVDRWTSHSKARRWRSGRTEQTGQACRSGHVADVVDIDGRKHLVVVLDGD